MNEKNILSIINIEADKKTNTPMFLDSVSAGFPSPATDYMENKLDLNEYLVKHPAATFFVRAKGYSMEEAGICDGDLLVVDKSIEVKNRDIVIACLDGEFTVKRYINNNKKIYLKAENRSGSYPNIKITEEMGFEIWGVVTHTIHKNR